MKKKYDALSEAKRMKEKLEQDVEDIGPYDYDDE